MGNPRTSVGPKAYWPLSVSILLVLAACSSVPTNVDPKIQETETSEEPNFSGRVNLVFDDPEICKLQENSRARKPGDPNPDYSGEREIYGRYSGNATAFPFAPTTLPITGSIDVALVYLDWEDNPGTQEDFNYYQDQVKMFRDFYLMVSENKLEMKIHSSKRWFRVKGNSKELSLTFEQEAQRGEAPRKQVFYDSAVAASDAEFDYSNIEIVFFAIPREKSVFFHGGPHEFNFDHNGHLRTQEGKIYNTTTPGDWFLNSGEDEPPWVNYVHEVGHMIGIPHQSNEDVQGEERLWIQNPLNGYDIMANQGGSSRTMTAWLRWLAGWLDDKQVVCVDKSNITENLYELTPVNEITSDKKALIVRISDSLALVIESRRFDEYFDRPSPNDKDGLIVYTVDATKGSAQANQALLSPRDITKYIVEPMWRATSELDAMFYEGDSVEVHGLVIEAHHIGTAKDVVSVSQVEK
jgi:M6 family metalloprotease-like protein